MNKKTTLSALLLATTLLTMGSCDDFLDAYSQDLVVAKSVSDLNELLIGDVYLKSGTVEYGMGLGTMGFVNALDDDISTTGTSASGSVANTAWLNVTSQLHGVYAWQADVRYNYGETNKQDDAATWKTLYKRISTANSIIDIIDEMPHSEVADSVLYHRVKGEAFFNRAQFYLALAGLYGRAYRPDSAHVDLCVPLKLTPNVEHVKDKDTQFERATTKQVYEQIIADLIVAERELTISPQPSRYRLHRASAEAAQILLSRAYLYTQQWEKAEAAAARAISSPNVVLAGVEQFVSNKPFLTSSNTEVIFSQGSNYVAPKRSNTSLTGDPADFCVSRELYDLYLDGDARRDVFFGTNSSSDSIKLTYKYERGLDFNHVSDHFLIRASEAYLNYAEACAMQAGKQAVAVQTLESFAAHRYYNLPDFETTGAGLVNDIRNERRREFCFEGQRWFDLRRYAEIKEYPLRKRIIHAYNVYSNAYNFVTTLYYALEPGDAAYTFSIPASIIEFDKEPMPNTIRPKREPIVIQKTPVLPPPTGEE